MVTSWAVFLSPEVKKRLEKIPNPDRRRILTALDALSNGPSGDIKPLKGRSEWKLRIGGWRILLEVEEPGRKIRVASIGSRGDVYK